MEESDLPEQVRAARAQVRKAEEAELVKALVGSATRFSSSGEQVCTWLLGAAGAAAALFLPNLAEVSELIGSTGARICLGLLVISVIAGLLAKRLAMFVQYQREMMDTFVSAAPQIYDAFTPHYEAVAPGTAHKCRADVRVLLNELAKSTPWFLRWRVRRGARLGAADGLWAYRQAMNRFGWQMLLVQVQWFTFAAAILAAAIYV